VPNSVSAAAAPYLIMGNCTSSWRPPPARSRASSSVCAPRRASNGASRAPTSRPLRPPAPLRIPQRLKLEYRSLLPEILTPGLRSCRSLPPAQRAAAPSATHWPRPRTWPALPVRRVPAGAVGPGGGVHAEEARAAGPTSPASHCQSRRWCTLSAGPPELRHLGPGFRGQPLWGTACTSQGAAWGPASRRRAVPSRATWCFAPLHNAPGAPRRRMHSAEEVPCRGGCGREAGLSQGGPGRVRTPLCLCEVYDPEADTWHEVPGSATPRARRWRGGW